MASDSKIRVMHVILNLETGGAQEVVRTLVQHMAEEDCESVVCTFRDGPVRHEIERLGVPVEVLNLPRRSLMNLPFFVLDMLRIRRVLLRLVDKYQIDVIQTHLLRILDFLVLSLIWGSRLWGVVWTFHSVSWQPSNENVLRRYHWLLKPKKQVYRFLYRQALRWVGAYVAVSDQVRDALIAEVGVASDRIITIANGVDLGRYQQVVDRERLRRELGFGSQEKLLITVGRLRVEKGHRYLIDAAAEIARLHPKVHFLLAGDGALRAELEAQVQAADLTQHVHFLGDRRDVPYLLAASDIFVLPSLWEGLSIALLEAMAVGLPIVASEVSGTVVAMVAGETGILVTPGDVGQLIAAIERLLSDPVCAAQMGHAARERVERLFSAQHQARAHAALYRRVLYTRRSERRPGRERAPRVDHTRSELR